MIFTSEEKYAILAVLTSIMKADGVEEPSEQAFIEKVCQKLDISTESCTDAPVVDVAACKSVFRLMPDDKKQRVEKCFLEMVGVDGRVDLRELRVLHDWLY